MFCVSSSVVHPNFKLFTNNLLITEETMDLSEGINNIILGSMWILAIL